MEKLAVVTRILDLQPIEGADKIEKASVLGWQVVTRKGIHAVGDMVVMIFPDSLVPKKYLDDSYVGDEKVRLKTVKLRGQYSAGLILPLSELPQTGGAFLEGAEVSALLDIEKWVCPVGVSLAGKSKGNFPTAIISKTDELNFRNEPLAIDEALTSEHFKNREFVATLKCDGSSGTFIYKDGEFRVCSRNLELIETEDNVFWQVARKYKLQESLSYGGSEYVLQGEVCGPGIQGNPMKLDELTLFTFLLKDVKNWSWFDWDYTKMFCSTHNIPAVEEIARFKLNELGTDIYATLQELANNTKYDHGRTNAEGIVIRSVEPIRSEALQKSWWSLKVMNQPYDMKKG